MLSSYNKLTEYHLTIAVFLLMLIPTTLLHPILFAL